MQLLAKFKKILYMGFRATLNFPSKPRVQRCKQDLETAYLGHGDLIVP